MKINWALLASSIRNKICKRYYKTYSNNCIVTGYCWIMSLNEIYVHFCETHNNSSLPNRDIVGSQTDCQKTILDMMCVLHHKAMKRSN